MISFYILKKQEHTGSPPEAKEMPCIEWLAILCGREGWEKQILLMVLLKNPNLRAMDSAVTCKVEAVIRVKLSVETVRMALFPENCMLIWPKTADTPLHGD